MVDLDIDIWGYGRDAAQAGRLSLPMLRACYPYIEVANASPALWIKVLAELPHHIEPNHYDQRRYLVRKGFIFFQSREDMELCRALLYIV